MSRKCDDTKIVDWVIYKITSPSGRIYIGKTSNFDKRLSHYRDILCNNQHIIKNSLSKYGFNAHTIEIIDQFRSNNRYANGKEMFWIRTYMSNFSKWPEMRGMNLTDGGQGTIGRKATEEQRKKQSERNKLNPPRTGKWPHSEETKEKLRIAQQKRIANPAYISPRKGAKLTDEQRAHLSKINMGSTGYWKGKKFSQTHLENMSKCKLGKPSGTKGKKMSEENKKRLSEILKGKPAWNKGIKSSEESKRKLSEYWTGRPNYNSRKKVLVYDKNFNFIKEVQGVKVASKEFNVSQSTILRHVTGQITNTRKYIFRYKKELIFQPYSFNRRVFNMVDIKDKIA